MRISPALPLLPFRHPLDPSKRDFKHPERFGDGEESLCGPWGLGSGGEMNEAVAGVEGGKG